MPIPRPTDFEPTAEISIPEIPLESAPTESWGGLGDIFGFLAEHFFLIFAVMLFLAAFSFLIWKFHKRSIQIEKLWVYILFFLTKRQMMIPLVITLSKKDEILDPGTQKELLEIRQKCREVSLKKQPKTRMSLEEQVSKILFFYFSTLEKKGQISAGTKFEKTVRDLEFIDSKLVQLQKIYNKEVFQWNRMVGLPGIKPIFGIFRLSAFQSFE